MEVHNIQSFDIHRLALNYNVSSVTDLRTKILSVPSRRNNNANRDVITFLATVSVRRGTRYGHRDGRRIDILDWFVRDINGREIMITSFGEQIDYVNSVYQSGRMPVLFINYVIGQRDGQPRHLFAVGSSLIAVSP